MTNLIQKVVNGVISLAIIVNAQAITPATQFTTLDLENAFVEADLNATALVAKTPLEEGVRRMMVDMTAYSSTPGQTDDSPFITASGHHVRDGIVAANFLPMYTQIKIPELFGEKVFVVEDRMNRRYTHRVDIWFADTKDAWKFGLKRVEIVVL
ncbi:MAG: hypothetical protein G01um10143_385 [Parcubacteria group bacterium Gr01-1014_3]|nr:MAG: hypothetical protein G01um10143_385 [Parcubacteria group bacterium Gr01-1014_3]